MSLRVLPAEAWEVLHWYLKRHHLGRLYLTGDRVVQHHVVHGHRTTDFATATNTTFVMHEMLPNTARASVSLRQLMHLANHESHPASPRVRSLFVACADLQCEEPPHVNLTHLSHLQECGLNFRHSTMMTLPASVTALHVDACPATSVVNFSALDSLVRMCVRMTTAQLRRFEHEVAWPPHLTSLELLAQCEYPPSRDGDLFVDALRFLPRTLNHLALSATRRDEDAFFDASPPASCPQLESFQIGSACTHPLRTESIVYPPTLTSLKLHYVPFSAQLCQALLATGALTHFSFSVFYRSPPALSEAEKQQWLTTLYTLLPRMDLDSVEHLVTHILLWGLHSKHAVPPPCLEALERVGLGTAYAAVIRLSGFPILSTQYCSTESLDACVALPAASRCLRRGNMRLRLQQRSKQFVSLRQWTVAHGLHDTIQCSDLHVIPIGGIHASIKNLLVDSVPLIVPLVDMFALHDLSSIETIQTLPAFTDWRRLVRALFQNRDRLRNLEEVHLVQDKTDVVSIELKDFDIGMLADMRLYRLPSSGLRHHIFRYRVSPPPPPTMN